MRLRTSSVTATCAAVLLGALIAASSASAQVVVHAVRRPAPVVRPYYPAYRAPYYAPWYYAPGFAFETLEWVARTELAALASDTWGCEVRPNNTEGGINQPWHWITIPIMGMTMGEIFQLKELGEDCAADKVYEFLFVAPAIPITGAVGSPVNPLAIK